MDSGDAVIVKVGDGDGVTVSGIIVQVAVFDGSEETTIIMVWVAV